MCTYSYVIVKTWKERTISSTRQSRVHCCTTAGPPSSRHQYISVLIVVTQKCTYYEPVKKRGFVLSVACHTVLSLTLNAVNTGCYSIQGRHL